MEIDFKVTGKTKVMGIIGNPIEHSFSPMLHNSISKHLGIDTVYIPFKVEKNHLESAVHGLKALNVVGFNVTVPYKKDVMKFIDDNTKEALLMGAVNTVKNIEGRFYGYNTDAEGFSRSFKEETGTGFKEKKIFIIGSGGAARAITVKMAFEGAKKIYIVNRTASKAAELAEIINNNIDSVAESFGFDDKKAIKSFEASDIVVNTTSVGMHPEVDSSPIEENYQFSKGQIVYDVVYNPSKTKFMSDAEKTGCKTVNGLGMLFYQGINAYEIWTGIKLSEQFLKELFVDFKSVLENR
ncbi:MAG: shikimate dehydrogenase [Clostridia bacterium]|nr:shikimate dehydrogenase [Clostridia bacterium]